MLSPPRASPSPLPQVPLRPTCGLIVVHIDSLQLQITVSMVTASGVDPMLITDDLPKLRHSKRLNLATPDTQKGQTHNE